jgi:hypothetical protein
MKNKIVNHFYVKEAKKDKKVEVPNYPRYTVNGERAEISTDRRVHPDLWDKVSERVTGRSESARTINTALNNLVSKVDKYFSSYDMRDELVSVCKTFRFITRFKKISPLINRGLPAFIKS